ncbi:hypothetical protein STAQ_18640 [Allostella sp. ATCC 35155]|nr:hypothetical protein STAQ_18640 [Stella sp. ATCC 35155]
MSDAAVAADPDLAAAMPFFASEFDLPPPTRPVRSYIIASTPRSGSMLLCDLLHRTGTMGVPTEYFNQRDMIVPTARRLGLALPVGTGTYIAALTRRRTSASGAFGVKMHFHQAWPLLGQRAFRQYLASSRFVWLRRGDLMAQATSLAIATRTNRWFRLRAAQGAAEPDAGTVDIGALFDAVARIRAETTFWQQFFAINRIRPLEITYEQLLEDAGRTVAAVGRLIQVEPGPVPTLDQSRFLPSAADESARWRDGVTTMMRITDDRAKA